MQRVLGVHDQGLLLSDPSGGFDPVLGGLDVVDGYVLASVAEHGPVSGLTRDAFSPGLMPGIGGVAYQLLRMHPDCRLPSVLLPDPEPVTG